LFCGKTGHPSSSHDQIFQKRGRPGISDDLFSRNFDHPAIAAGSHFPRLQRKTPAAAARKCVF
jgi:hypothetical protein